MAETTADVRRDIEVTRERMSNTLAQLEQKLNVTEMVREHPWPALALALGAGFALSGSKADVKAAAATVTATKGASSKLADVLDEAVAGLMGTVHGAIEQKVDALLDEVRSALGARTNGTHGTSIVARRATLADVSTASATSDGYHGVTGETQNSGRADGVGTTEGGFRANTSGTEWTPTRAD